MLTTLTTHLLWLEFRRPRTGGGGRICFHPAAQGLLQHQWLLREEFVGALGVLPALPPSALSCSGAQKLQRPRWPLGALNPGEGRTCFPCLQWLPQVGWAQVAPGPPQASPERPGPGPSGLLPELGSPSRAPRHHGPRLLHRRPEVCSRCCSRLHSP